ncbi:hypothetical protein M409DRAFT_49868 [Zasmidium cellare ATCC 36951]|uniref:Putative peptidase domain-containing protein n=1 Tax=Zasmidium cellare ATCC 36951 TaxID=1080233 RepID=A0A6A6D386_ZASCE|nr:uncharacterized protein M409DRAFT_49868 [Zasmidium cellare ATCC 36951]KAF2172126.1 hypothetical protein M409DRAFT_49868 [Zasmidium cellare ATCC 36951]
MYTIPAVLLSALAAVSAAPTPVEEKRQAPFEVTEQAPWNSGAVTQWRVHSSCNSSEAYQIRQGLDEAVELASHAKAHINRWGNSSEIYQKYFGGNPTVEAVGSLDVIINGDRSGALFRCDDPDQNCVNMPDWAGHWRGNNASDETVICPTSYEIRRPLAGVCGLGWNVRQGGRTVYWGSDLMHRLWHMPAFGQGYVDHYAEDYDSILEAASANSPNATKDSYGLIYFALEAFAHDVIYPGTGCPGPAGELPASSSPAAAASATSSAASSASAPAVTSASTAAVSASATAVAENCHTHSNGDVHCSEATATVSESASATAASAEASATESASGENCHTHANGELHCV